MGEEIYGIPALTVEVAEETVLPTAEGEECHRGSDTDVNADVSDLCLITELSGGCAATCKETCHIPVTPTVDERDRIVDSVNMNESENRSEDFSAGNIALRIEVTENRWTDEVSIFAPGDTRIPTINKKPRTFISTRLNQPLNSGLAFGGDDGSHLGSVFQSVPDDAVSGGVSDGFCEPTLCVTNGEGKGGGKTTLPSTPKRTLRRGVNSELRIGIGKNDERIFRTALALDALSVCRGFRIDGFRRCGRTDETNRTNIGMR